MMDDSRPDSIYSQHGPVEDCKIITVMVEEVIADLVGTRRLVLLDKKLSFLFGCQGWTVIDPGNLLEMSLEKGGGCLFERQFNLIAFLTRGS